MTRELNIKDLIYHIFPSKRMTPSSFAELHDATFNFFVRRWEEAFAATQEEARPAPGWEDHFLKQDLIGAITYQGEVVAAHLYTIYDLSAASTRKSECFSFIQPETIQNMQGDGINNVISMEYLCVDQSVRRNSLDISFGKLITSLGTFLCENKGMDGAIGTPIKNNKVDQMMLNVGAYHIQSDFKKYGYMVDLLFIPSAPAQTSKDPKVAAVAADLWDRRKDYTAEFYSKIAA